MIRERVRNLYVKVKRKLQEHGFLPVTVEFEIPREYLEKPNPGISEWIENWCRSFALPEEYRHKPKDEIPEEYLKSLKTCEERMRETLINRGWLK